MEVVPKRASIFKEERKMDSCGSVEEVEKIGSEKKRGEGGSLESSSPNQRDSSTSNQVSTVIAGERPSMDTSSRPSPSNTKGPTPINNQDQLESTKAEMGEIREENDRLKTLLARIVKDYQSLQMHFLDIVQQEQAKKSAETPPPPPPPAPHDVEEPDHLVSLSLGTTSSVNKKEAEKPNTASKNKENDQIEEGLTLGLDCKYKGSSNGTNTMSPSNSVEETKEEDAGEPGPPSKILKNMRSGPEDEVSQQAHVKKTRVSVRARCDAPTMPDGCQWRKYGQKIAKGNPCPRGYYRCTVAPACPVRKQVQRCSEDMSILITTYEGTHNHPLPISATAMASTTSAAACMLMSGSSTSRPTVISSLPSSSPSLPTTTSSTVSSSNPNLHALNFNLIDPNSRSSRPFYLPNPTISSTPSYPIITLDLTSPPQPSSQPSHFSRIFSSSNFTTSSSSTPRYSTSFNFSSSESNISSTSLPTSWANGPYLSYAASNQPYTESPIGSLGLNASNQQDNLYQSCLQNVVNPVNGGGAATQHALTDMVARAITSDPSFQSALAAAITSYVGGGTNAAQNLTAAAVNGCGSSFLTRTGSGSASSKQQGINSLMFMQSTPLAFCSSKSTSASPVDNRENIK